MFTAKYLRGQTHFRPDDFNESSTSDTPQPDARPTEDCLFLDVVVPRKIFHRKRESKGAPVLVWIYGGGYVGGWKSEDGNPAGLLKISQSQDGDGLIYVSLNYRLGAFGWLSGPSFQADGLANAGLHDQRFALAWIREHIAKFGGDPERVTVMGESAGAGSIMHQITAYGGRSSKTPFQQAILQSPAFPPIVSHKQQEDAFKKYLFLLGVHTLAEARQLPSSRLIEANTRQVADAPYSQFVFGPTVDGDLVPDLPGTLLLHGQYDRNVSILVGHNADEGLALSSPYINNDTALKDQVTAITPSIQSYPDVLDTITRDLYPPEFDGSQSYTDQVARAALFIGDEFVTCNAHFLGKAYVDKAFAYLFAVPPALHGQDIGYTFYNGPSPLVVNDTVAKILQDYIVNFAETGSPNGHSVPFFPHYGLNATVQGLNDTGIDPMTDPGANERCDWWQQALFE